MWKIDRREAAIDSYLEVAMTMKDRQQDFEARFAHGEELRFRAEARRGKLLGLWAAGLLGKTGDEAAAYAQELVKMDVSRGGDQDVFEKLRKDFDAAGVQQSDHQIRRHMEELLVEAQAQIQNS